MLKSMLAFALVAMLFGCLGQPYQTGPQPAQNQSQTNPYPSAPTANVSAQGTQQGANASQQNQSAPPARPNTTAVAPPAPQPALEMTNLSAGALLDNKLAGMPNKDGGPYYEKTYTWVSQAFENSPTTVTLANPTYAVLFGGDPEPQMVAFGFKTYQPTTGPTTASGYVLVYSGSAMLDNLTASSLRVDIGYTTPQNVKMALNGTTMMSKETVLDIDNRTVAVYGFETDGVH